MMERFTDRAREALHTAQFEARALDAGSIGPEHVLLGLLRVEGSVAHKVLADLGVTYDAARAAVEASTEPFTGQRPRPIPFTPVAKRVLEASLRAAVDVGHNHIGTEHLLLGLLSEHDGTIAKVLTSLTAGAEAVRAKVYEAIQVRAATGTEGVARFPQQAGDPAAMPRCPSCKNALDLRSSIQEPTGDAPFPFRLLLIYCGSCGVVIHAQPAGPTA